MPTDFAEREGSQDAAAGDAFPTIGFVSACLFLAAYLFLAVVTRAALPWSLLPDEAEQAFLSQFFLLGYGPQPPLYDWIQAAIVSFGGLSMWTLSGTKFGMLFLCYVFYGLAAREVLGDRRLAAFAMLTLLTLPQVSYMPQQDLTHTVAVLVATSLFLYAAFRTLSRPSVWSYLLLGIAAGLGFISKYNFAILPVAIFVAVLGDRGWRPRLMDRRILLTFATGLLIVLPHTLWLLGHFDLASAGTLKKMKPEHGIAFMPPAIMGLISLLQAILAFCALTLVIFFAVFRREGLAALRAGDRYTRLMERMMVVSLVLVALVVVATGATHLTERWLNPFLLALPLYLFAKLKAAGLDMGPGLRRLWPVVPIIMIVTLLPLGGQVLGARYINSYNWANAPFRELVEKMVSERRPSLVLADSVYVGGNVRLKVPADLPVRTAAVIAPGDDLGDAVLAVWRPPRGTADLTVPADIAGVLEAAGLATSGPQLAEAPYYFGKADDRYRLGYAWYRQSAAE